jgi:hypothetical protein
VNLRKAIKELWKEARQNYLDSIHVKESEVRKDHWGNQYFIFDGFKIDMPMEYHNATYYYKFNYLGIIENVL